jgi:hypothetical protein
MSHKATNWAVTVRGIPPAAKVVLWHLADRHNKDTGQCNPSQALLADDCEMSRSSLNNQLALLERAGLIKRVQAVDAKTKRQLSTSYILCFNNSEPQEPCPKSGHGAVSKSEAEPCPNSGQSRVQNLDTNPVKEPVKEPRANAPLCDQERKRRSAQTSDVIKAMRERLNAGGATP